MTYRLKNELRPKLKKPLGRLYKESEDPIKEILSEINLDRTGVVTVGDVTTYKLLKNDFTPEIAIVDGRVMREEASRDIRSLIDSWQHETVSVENPAGHITTELMKAVEQGFNSTEPTLISVEGEEDLAVLPAVLYAPEGYIILYGQPKEGLVSVKVDQDCKDKVISFIELMEET